jgi:uncharacterized membrane protein
MSKFPVSNNAGWLLSTLGVVVGLELLFRSIRSLQILRRGANLQRVAEKRDVARVAAVTVAST